MEIARTLVGESTMHLDVSIALARLVGHERPNLHIYWGSWLAKLAPYSPASLMLYGVTVLGRR